ncbi:MAG: [Fe-S]-binding protein, partial [Syntrophus sp. (in: bacteria)]|nr:[Fe-S]-binding protein [Syntrophus sp. (in: bacteria)]
MDFPNMVRLRQTFDRTMVADIPGAIQAELKKLALEQRIRPGQRIGLTGGSRGVANIALILKTVVDYLKSLGARPFIFPAMGSHGGATAEGQRAMLAHYQVTEAFTGAPVYSSMDTVEISRTQDGVPVFIDKYAFEADGIIVINRIKPHTKFKAPIESGLMKMMAIGMGKQKGAEYYHKAAIQCTFPKIIVDAGREVLKKAPILCGLGLVENGYDQTAVIAALPPEDLEAREKELLVLAKRMMPRLPFDEIDLLIIDEMGKDISGMGIDPNVTGRNRDILGVFPHPVNARRLFVRDLTPSSSGNATGIGVADITTKRLVDKIDRLSTYMNCI